MRIASLALIAVSLGAAGPLQGADADIDPSVAQSRTVDATIEAVVLYQGRAAVTRVASQALTPGLWKLRFDSLPLSMQADTLEARSSSGRILSVDFALRPVADAASTPQAASLDDDILKLKQSIGATLDLLAGLQNELKVIESVGVRASTDASKDGGSAKLDLASLDSQLKWMSEQRARASSAIRALTEKSESLAKELTAAQARRGALGGEGTAVPSAEVLLAMTSEETVSVRLSYLVTDARWEPAYAFRAATDRNAMTIEFDAVVTQHSGEDWKGVRLSLSTARPSRAASPAAVTPWFVDVLDRMPAVTGFVPSPSVAADMPAARGEMPVEAEPTGGTLGRAARMREQRKSVAQELSVDAAVGGSGPSVTYTIALPFDAPSDDQLRRRARIAAFEAPATYVYQAQPVVSDGVFLRGTLTNASAYQLLRGKASVFVGADYVGATEFAGAAPKQEFEVFFGADPAVTARRELVKREDRQSGLFGGGLDSVSDYRVTLVNGSGRPIQVELLDRRPVSRSDKIEVRVTNNGAPLSTDAQYLAETFPQGILRWDLSVPPTPTGAAGTPVNWTVTVSRSKDIDLTPLPRE